MANLTIPAPTEPEKSDWLHQRSERPPAPAVSRVQLLRQYAGLIAGVVLAVGLTATMFSLRDSWHNHREWLVTLIPFLVIAALSLSYLTIRGELTALAPGLLFLFVALLFTLFDVLADNDSGATDRMRDVFSILGGIALGFATAALAVALVWIEAAKPPKAPAPEL